MVYTPSVTGEALQWKCVKFLVDLVLLVLFLLL